MDGRRFDALTRALTAAGSRRRVIGGAIAALVGGAVVVEDAGARPALCRPAGRYCTTNKQCCNTRCRTGKRVPIGSRNLCDCDAPLAMCGKMCRDLSSDANNCGACGNQIDRYTERCCDGVPTPIDADNCGACGDVCGPDDVCCGDDGGCVDVNGDPNHCGGCGIVCDSGLCEAGECISLEPCGELAPDKVYCVYDVESRNTYANCGIITRLPYAAGSDEVVPCTTNADCTDAFGACALADVTCVCGTHAGVYPVGYETASDSYGEPSVCVALTTNTSNCDGTLLNCAEVGGNCSVDSDCCHGAAQCTGGTCQLPSGGIWACSTGTDCIDTCCTVGSDKFCDDCQ